MVNYLVYILKKLLFRLLRNEKFTGTYAYRKYLFQELTSIFSEDQFKNKRFLEIGPKDGEDTERLYTLNPDEHIMFDLPDKSDQNE